MRRRVHAASLILVLAVAGAAASVSPPGAETPALAEARAAAPTLESDLDLLRSLEDAFREARAAGDPEAIASTSAALLELQSTDLERAGVLLTRAQALLEVRPATPDAGAAALAAAKAAQAALRGEDNSTPQDASPDAEALRELAEIVAGAAAHRLQDHAALAASSESVARRSAARSDEASQQRAERHYQIAARAYAALDQAEDAVRCLSAIEQLSGKTEPAAHHAAILLGQRCSPATRTIASEWVRGTIQDPAGLRLRLALSWCVAMSAMQDKDVVAQRRAYELALEVLGAEPQHLAQANEAARAELDAATQDATGDSPVYASALQLAAISATTLGLEEAPVLRQELAQHYPALSKSAGIEMEEEDTAGSR